MWQVSRSSILTQRLLTLIVIVQRYYSERYCFKHNVIFLLYSRAVASGGVASGAVAAGAVAAGAVDAGAVAPGAVAAGAVASGAVASGAVAVELVPSEQ